VHTEQKCVWDIGFSGTTAGPAHIEESCACVRVGEAGAGQQALRTQSISVCGL